MKYLIIIPAHNEEEFVQDCLNSLKQQSVQDFHCVIVNDGSTDKTGEIAENFSQSDARFEVLHLEKSEHQPGAKVVETFNKGLESQYWNDFDVICKFDADIVFPENYLKKIGVEYTVNPKIGMVSGLVYIKKDGEWEYEDLSNKDHVRGPIKSYRKECFHDINGLRPVLGWDNLDVMLAKMHGWEVVTIKNIWVKHLRPTAGKYQKEKAKKLGEYFHNIGLNFPLALVSSAKSSWKNKSPFEFFVTMNSFLKQKTEPQLSEEEIEFIRKYRWEEVVKKFRKP